MLKYSEDQEVIRAAGLEELVRTGATLSRTFGVETIELDLPPLAGRLSRRLHDAGIPITPGRSIGFAQALTLVRPVARRQLYWTARAVFVTDPAQVTVFDAVFSSIFGKGASRRTSLPGRRAHHRRAAGRQAGVGAPASRGDARAGIPSPRPEKTDDEDEDESSFRSREPATRSSFGGGASTRSSRTSSRSSTSSCRGSSLRPRRADASLRAETTRRARRHATNAARRPAHRG